MPNDQIRSRIEAFVNDLSDAVRKAAIDAVREALGGTETAPKAPGRRGRPASEKVAPTPQTKATKHASGQKRDPKDLAKLAEKLAAHIVSHPGERIEQINKALRVPTKDLTLPIKKLLKAKRISSKGQRRSTTYYPAASVGARAAKKGNKPEPAAEAKSE